MISTDGLELETSAAWQAISRSARKAYKIISEEIDAAGGTSAPVKYLDFEAGGCSTNTLSVVLRSLDYLGLIDRQPGPHMGVIYSLSDRWRGVSENEATRLLALAREIVPRENGRAIPQDGPP
jgi:DNA-binding HxlR family transcriptional regulator